MDESESFYTFFSASSLLPQKEGKKWWKAKISLANVISNLFFSFCLLLHRKSRYMIVFHSSGWLNRAFSLNLHWQTPGGGTERTGHSQFEVYLHEYLKKGRFSTMGYFIGYIYYKFNISIFQYLLSLLYCIVVYYWYLLYPSIVICLT